MIQNIRNTPTISMAFMLNKTTLSMENRGTVMKLDVYLYGGIIMDGILVLKEAQMSQLNMVFGIIVEVVFQMFLIKNRI